MCRRRRHCFAPPRPRQHHLFLLTLLPDKPLLVFHFRPPRLASRRAMAELSRSAGSSRKSWGSQLSGKFRELLADPSDVFLARGRSGKHDEAALRESAMQKLSGSKLDPDILDSRREKVFIDEGVQILEENEQLVRRIRERMNRSGFFRRFLYFLSFFRKKISFLNWRIRGWGLKCQRSKSASKDFPPRRTLTWGGGLSPPYLIFFRHLPPIFGTEKPWSSAAEDDAQTGVWQRENKRNMWQPGGREKNKKCHLSENAEVVPVSEPSKKVVPVFESGKRSCQYLIITLKVVPLYDVNPFFFNKKKPAIEK